MLRETTKYSVRDEEDLVLLPRDRAIINKEIDSFVNHVSVTV